MHLKAINSCTLNVKKYFAQTGEVNAPCGRDKCIEKSIFAIGEQEKVLC